MIIVSIPPLFVDLVKSVGQYFSPLRASFRGVVPSSKYALFLAIRDMSMAAFGAPGHDIS